MSDLEELFEKTDATELLKKRRRRMTDLELVEAFTDIFARNTSPEHLIEFIDHTRDKLLRILRRGLLMTQHDFENRPTLTDIKIPDPPRPDDPLEGYFVTNRCSYCGNHHRTVQDGVRGCHAFKKAVLKLFSTYHGYMETDADLLDELVRRR
jgi:hypothetical protein